MLKRGHFNYVQLHTDTTLTAVEHCWHPIPHNIAHGQESSSLQYTHSSLLVQDRWFSHNREEWRPNRGIMGSVDNASKDDDHNSTDAVVMKRRSMEDQADVLSVRSMPLMKDDDYFYYHGEGGKEDDDDDETVDHIGLLIGGPTMLQYPPADNPSTSRERDFGASLRSMTSEVTYDNHSDFSDMLSVQDNKPHYTTQDYIEMKLEIADLKAQLDGQQFRDREKYTATISSLQDRIMSLECENIELKQKLKESQAVALSLREGAVTHHVEHRLQVKARLRQLQPRTMSRCSEDSEEMSNCSEEEKDFLPFPEKSRRTQSRQVSSFGPVGRRPSLIDSFCQPFRRSSAGNTAMTSSPESSVDSDDLGSHYSWANADEINEQTGIFNKKSISKLEEDAAKRGCLECEPVLSLSLSLNDKPISSQQHAQTPPSQKPKLQRKRRQSFTLGERRPSLKDLLSINRGEEGIDVESELWDNFDDVIDASFKSEGTGYGTVLTAGW